MNLFQLVLKQMRQRSLSTWLTLLSVLLGVALAVAIMIMRREAGALFAQDAYGYDVIVGAKGSPLQLVLNTVYHIGQSPGNIPYSVYEQMDSPTYRGMVKIAVPQAVGDSYQNHSIVGTTNRLFNVDEQGKPVDYIKFIKDADGHSEGDTEGLAPEQARALIDSGAAQADPSGYFQYRPGQSYQLDHGRWFVGNKFEAVIGSAISRETKLKLGDTFRATHGLPLPGQKPDIHKPVWKVVGVLAPTHTAADHVIYIPLLSFYTIAEHDVGLVAQNALRKGENPNQAVAAMQHTAGKHGEEEEPEHYTIASDGTIKLDLPKSIWGLSAILIKSRSPAMAMKVLYNIRNGPTADAVNPASQMRDFFANFLKGPSLVLLLIALLVTIVAGVGILVSIYNSVSARLREIAILRALGATRAKILTLICVEAGFIGLIGGILGLIGGHLLGAAGSAFTKQLLGEGINWVRVGNEEWWYLAIVIVIAVLAGLVPALKAYRTPVATNLVAV